VPGIGSHQSAHAKSVDWLTPPDIIESLGQFDLDPCCPPQMPWRTADVMLTPHEDGLSRPWSGRVWLNPPYGRDVGPWLARLAEHGHGVALIFARTETTHFVEHVWRAADALMFLFGRLYFHYPDGTRAKMNGGAPSVLVAYGEPNAQLLARCSRQGHVVRIR